MTTATMSRTAQFVSLPEVERQKKAIAEIHDLQLQFSAMRALGVWTSPYPQVGFSRVLGCSVREVIVR